MPHGDVPQIYRLWLAQVHGCRAVLLGWIVTVTHGTRVTEAKRLNNHPLKRVGSTGD